MWRLSSNFPTSALGFLPAFPSDWWDLCLEDKNIHSLC